jgi:hypothetical protein
MVCLIICYTIFYSKTSPSEATGGWRKLHNEELHNLYSSPSIIRMMKSKRMRLAGHVARMGEKKTAHMILWESQMERVQ